MFLFLMGLQFLLFCLYLQLDLVYVKLSTVGADDYLIVSVFAQLAQWMCACSLNHLMFRKDLCNAERAMQIKYVFACIVIRGSRSLLF
jgi:hypothetical protein